LAPWVSFWNAGFPIAEPIRTIVFSTQARELSQGDSFSMLYESFQPAQLLGSGFAECFVMASAKLFVIKGGSSFTSGAASAELPHAALSIPRPTIWMRLRWRLNLRTWKEPFAACLMWAATFALWELAVR
jgi:hypothetical protein